MMKKLLSLLMGLLLFSFMSAKTWYVKSGGTGTGDTWATAAPNLSTVFTNATFASGDVVNIGAGTYSTPFTLPAGKDVTIIGGYPAAGGTTYDPVNNITTLAQTQTPVFAIGATSGSLSLKGLTFNGGGNSVVVWTAKTSGTYYFTDIQVLNKTATAFFVSGTANDNIIINFVNLYATGNTRSVITVSGNNLTADTTPVTVNVTQSQFCNNQGTTVDGLAINAYNFANVNTSNSRFINNFARLGGAINIGENNLNAARYTSTNDEFSGNKAHKGGAINIKTDLPNGDPTKINGNPNYKISSSKFIDNESNAFSGPDAADGGGISFYGDYLKSIPVVENSEFCSNATPSNDGGAIFMGHSDPNFGYALLSINNTYVRNEGGLDGGAVCLWGPQGVPADVAGYGFAGKSVIFSGDNFQKNYTVNRGGGIAWIIPSNDAYNVITNTKFKGNTAGQHGGAVFIGGNTITNDIVNSDFEINRSNTNGGAVYNTEGITTFTNDRFARNMSGGSLIIESTSAGGPDIWSPNTNSATVKTTINGGVLQMPPAYYNHTNWTFNAPEYYGNTTLLNLIADIDCTIANLTCTPFMLVSDSSCNTIPEPQFAQTTTATSVFNGVTVTRTLTRDLYSTFPNTTGSITTLEGSNCRSISPGYAWLRAEDSTSSQSVTYTFSSPQTSIQVFLMLMGNKARAGSYDEAVFTVNGGGDLTLQENPTYIDCLNEIDINDTTNTVSASVNASATDGSVIVSSPQPFTTLTITNPRTGVFGGTTDGYGYYVEICPSSVRSAPVICYNAPATVGTILPTKHGVTTLQRAGVNNGNWPMVRNGAWTALEANSKGFVITRMTSAQISAIVAPQEGMMVYDITNACLSIYSTGAWKCFKTPSCP